MSSVLLVIHMFLALAIIGLVLLQRSEGGGLGIGGGGGGMGGFATAQGATSILTRATAICATGFFITSLLLGVLAGRQSSAPGLIEAVQEAAPAIEIEAEAPSAPIVPEAPINTE